MARRMVTEWGMSDKLGPLRYHDNEEEVFLGHSVTQRKNLSDATAKVIDEEIRSFVDGGQKSARKIITERIDDLHKLANGLLEYETLSGEDIEAVLNDQPLVRPSDEDDATKDEGRRASVPESGRKRQASPGKLEPEPQPGS